MLYQSRYFKAGAAANRLATAWVKKDKDFILSSFYSGFIQGMIPMRGGEDMLEPYVAFRQFSETNSTYDIGLYYTYNNLIMAGAAVRQGSVASLTTSFRINKKFLIGYSHEIILGDIRSQVGSTNEFTLRFDFNEYDYKANFRTDYRNSLAYRRKTLPIAKPVKTPAQFHKNQKKSKAYSPNKRYQQTRKHKVQPSSNRKLKVAKTRRHAKVYNPMRR